MIAVVFYFFQEFMPVPEERWRGKSQNFPSSEKLQGNLSCSSNKDVAPCKGIQDSLGFRIPGAGFRIPAQWIPDSKKSWIPFYCPVLMLFFALRFRVRILLYWKTLLEGITSLFSFSIYRITGSNVLQFRKGLWYNNEGDIGGLCSSQHRRKK